MGWGCGQGGSLSLWNVLACLCHVVEVKTVGVYLCLAFVWLKHSLRGKLHLNPLTELKNTAVCDFYLHEASHMRHPLIIQQNSIAEDCFTARSLGKSLL